LKSYLRVREERRVEVDREEVEELPRGAEDADEDVTRKRRRRRRTKGAAKEEEEEEEGGGGRDACADETRSGTCGPPHRSEPVRGPHTSPLFNLSTWTPASSRSSRFRHRHRLCHLLMRLVASSLFQMRERESRP